MSKATNLRAAARATAAVVTATEKRDASIRAAAADGEDKASVRAIAEATGLSTTRVHQIIHGRSGNEGK